MGAVRDILYSRMGGKFSTPFLALLIKRLYMASPSAGPSYEELTVSGNAPLTLANAVAKAIKSLTQTGLCAQASTPTPSAPVDIKCNNGTLTTVDDELPAGYNRVLGFSMKNNAYWEIPNFPMNGSDTLRFSFEATDACNVIGAYSGSASGNNYSLYVSQSSNYLRYKNGAYNSTVDFDTRYDVEITPTGSSGMKVDSTWTAQTFTTPTNFCIGTTSVTASSAKLKGNLYGNIEVVGRAKFIPCERISDNVLGYYDLIGETFYMPTSGTPTSLGYDGSHCHLVVVGTPEVLTVSASGATDQTATVESLLAVGSVADEQNLINGVVIRRCAVCRYDGTQTIGDVYMSTTGGKDLGAIIVYPLDEPVTELVTAQPLNTSEGTNTVSVTAEVSPVALEAVYYGSEE